MKKLVWVITFLVTSWYCISEAKNASTFSLTNVQYYNSDKISYGANSSAMVTRPVEVSLEQKWVGNLKTYHGAIEATALLSSGNPDRYLNFKDLYYASSEDATFQVAFGRKKESWSYADEFWQMGLWQPRFRVDFLRPEQQGLIGGFAKVKDKNFQIRVLASPLYNPDITPTLHIENGRLYANTPWFHPPVQEIDFEGNTKKVYYEQRVPEVDQIILRPSAAVSTAIFLDESWLVQASYTYKPMNQVLIGFDQAIHTEVYPSYSAVTATPRILHHHVGALELVKTGDTFGHLSISGDQVVKDETPQVWTTQEVDPSRVASVLLGSNFGEFLNRPLKAYVGYYRVWGGDLPDAGPLASKISFFEPRFSFTDAISVGLQTAIPGLTSKLQTEQKLLYDFDQVGVWYSGEVTYQPENDWKLSFGADLLGIAGDGDAKNPRAFLRRYRANDNVRGGVSYVF